MRSGPWVEYDRQGIEVSRTLRTLQTDLVGRLCRTFDPFDPEGIIPPQLTKWFGDYGIAVPNRT